jgi:hypothetical protein
MQDESKDRKNSPASDTPERKPVLRNGWWVLPATGRVVTTEMIKQIQQELDDEEVERANKFARGEQP